MSDMSKSHSDSEKQSIQSDVSSKASATHKSDEHHSTRKHPSIAPLHIPPARRLQTFCVIVFMVFPIICIGINAYFLFRAQSTLVFGLYLALLTYSLFFMRLPSRGGFASSWFRSLPFFALVRDYFPIRVHCDDVKFDPKRSYLIGYHPHGILSVGALLTWGTLQTDFSSHFPHMKARLCTLDAQFRLPFWNVILLMMGLIGCSRQSIAYVLQRPGYVCALVLGGAKESLDSFAPTELPLQPLQHLSKSVGIPQKHRRAKPHHSTNEASNHEQSDEDSPKSDSLNPVLLHLSNRRGFVLLALQSGASLVPAFGFGELSLWEQMPNPRGSKLRTVQDKITSIVGFAPPVFSGRGVFQYRLGLLPKREPINIHIGRPIDCPLTSKDQCSHELVEKYYEMYRAELVRMFDENKKRYHGMEDATLVFV